MLLDRVLEGAASAGARTAKVILNELDFVPCQECEDLKDDGSCKIEDELQPVYDQINEADVLILASPVFFGSVSAQTKMMIDRFQCLWRAKFILETVRSEELKKGAFICVEASDREDFFDNARSIVKNFFKTTGFSYDDEIMCPGVENKGDVAKFPEVMEKAFKMGEVLGS